MPFAPHTDEEVAEMLATIGEPSIDALFDEIPVALRVDGVPDLAPGIGELPLTQRCQQLARLDECRLNFIGAGAYEHHIPAAVWDLVGRGEFMTAYTPYQAEASQGGLQLIYEFQTMIAKLTGMDIANASLYDGASALAEAVLMAVRANRRSKTKTVLMPSTVNPFYRETVHTLVNGQEIKLIELPFCTTAGKSVTDVLTQYDDQAITAIVVQQPNFFGVLEDVDAITTWAHAHEVMVIGCVNPTSLALLKEPGAWGDSGADIVVGEGQPLGVPLASGGPYFGFMSCKKAFVRQMPGRLVGRTVDTDGREGFALTLQAREQHIRRSKATSNICTNQGLLVTAATIYMSLMGEQGLRQVALKSHQNTCALRDALEALPTVEQVFTGAFFHEIVLRLKTPVQTVLDKCADAGVQAGFALGSVYPELNDCLLVCATETKTAADMAVLVELLR